MIFDSAFDLEGIALFAKASRSLICDHVVVGIAHHVDPRCAVKAIEADDKHKGDIALNTVADLADVTAGSVGTQAFDLTQAVPDAALDVVQRGDLAVDQRPRGIRLLLLGDAAKLRGVLLFVVQAKR